MYLYISSCIKFLWSGNDKGTGWVRNMIIKGNNWLQSPIGSKFNPYCKCINTHCMLSNFSCICCSLLTFFQFLSKNSFRNTEYQMVWIQSMIDDLSSWTTLILNWVQTVCKGYQLPTKVAASKERLNNVSWSYLKHIALLTFFHYLCDCLSWKAIHGCRTEIKVRFVWFDSLCPSQQYFSNAGMVLPELNHY